MEKSWSGYSAFEEVSVLPRTPAGTEAGQHLFARFSQISQQIDFAVHCGEVVFPFLSSMYG